MSILDQIANPGPNSYLQALKVYDSIETNRNTRRLSEIQAGLTLQKMQAARSAQQQQTRGYNVIQDFLSKGTQASSTAGGQVNPVNAPTIRAEGPPQLVSPKTVSGEEAVGPPQQVPPMQAVDIMTDAVKDIPVDQLDQTDWTALGTMLSTNPAMAKQSQYFLDLGIRTKEYMKKQTAAEKADAELLFEVTANPLREVVKLEDKGEFDKAEQRYKQIIPEILADPRFRNNDKIQQFYSGLAEYKPGRGKFIYTTTMYGKKARDQFQKSLTGTKGSDYRRYTDADGMVWEVNRLDETDRHLIGPSWTAEKEKAIQERATAQAAIAEKRIKLAEDNARRADERIGMQREKLNQTQQKFKLTSTDQIIKFLNQETKDLKEVKTGLERALTLATSGGDMALVDKLLKQAMSKWENTSVRAVAELDQFSPAKIGNLEERIAGSISLFFKGEMTDTQRQKVIETAKTLYDKVVTPALTMQDDYWRRLAADRGLDPDQVKQYKTKEEVGEAFRRGDINENQAALILSKSRFKLK